MNVPLKVMSDSLRQQIQLFNKKKIDIAPLINGYNIANEDLSNSYISELLMSDRDISNCNLSHSSIKLILNNGVARNCNFTYCTFLDGTCFRGADIRNTNFNYSYAAHVDFAYADARDADFCDATITVFSKKFYKAKFSKKLLVMMSRFFDIEGLDIKNESP